MAKHRKKRRTAAQVRAFKKMLAGLRRSKAGHSVRRTVKRARRALRRRRSSLNLSGVQPVARRKSSRRRRSSRARSRRRGGFVAIGGLNKGTLGTAVVTGAGFALVNMALDKLSTPGADGKSLLPASLSTGVPRIVAKAGLSWAASMAAKKLRAPSIARGILIGGLVSCVLDLVSVATAKASSLRGMDDWPNQPQLGADPDPQLSGSRGMGDVGNRGDVSLQRDLSAM